MTIFATLAHSLIQAEDLDILLERLRLLYFGPARPEQVTTAAPSRQRKLQLMALQGTRSVADLPRWLSKWLTCSTPSFANFDCHRADHSHL